ncbi:MAG: hypothetical protein PHE49_08405 [bacterium]|nr:hypothetical protein [bacterium]
MEFRQRLSLTIITILLGGVALWTWQKKYWEYQLSKERQDWQLRECYSRKESQREEMEKLLLEMNKGAEEFLTAATLAASTIQWRNEYYKKGTPNLTLLNQNVDKYAEKFNEIERDWLVNSRVMAGKIRLYFDDKDGNFEKAWIDIVEQSGNMCSLFHSPNTTFNDVLSTVDDLRNKKNNLLELLELEIDRFVLEKLETK